MGFHLTVFSRIRTKSTILSLYRRTRSVKTRILAYCFIVIADDKNFSFLGVVSFTLNLDNFDERNLLI